MTDFPNREHANADKAARRRALKALGDLIDEASLLKAGLEATDPPHNLFASDARRLAALSLSVSENLSIAETLRDVREWHEADQADAYTNCSRCSSMAKASSLVNNLCGPCRADDVRAAASDER